MLDDAQRILKLADALLILEQDFACGHGFHAGSARVLFGALGVFGEVPALLKSLDKVLACRIDGVERSQDDGDEVAHCAVAQHAG